MAAATASAIATWPGRSSPPRASTALDSTSRTDADWSSSSGTCEPYVGPGTPGVRRSQACVRGSPRTLLARQPARHARFRDDNVLVTTDSDALGSGGDRSRPPGIGDQAVWPAHGRGRPG